MRDLLRAVGAVVPRPRLWWTALVEFRRLLPDRWWGAWPFLPVPDPALLRFRATTQYGDPTHPPDPDDLVTWLSWCKAENRRRRIR